MPVSTKQRSDLILSFVEMCLIEGHAVVTEPLACAEHLEIHLDWDHHKVVARLAKHGTLRLGNSDYLERPILNLDRLPDWIDIREELFLNVVADEHYGHPAG